MNHLKDTRDRIFYYGSWAEEELMTKKENLEDLKTTIRREISKTADSEHAAGWIDALRMVSDRLEDSIEPDRTFIRDVLSRLLEGDSLYDGTSGQVVFVVPRGTYNDAQQLLADLTPDEVEGEVGKQIEWPLSTGAAARAIGKTETQMSEAVRRGRVDPAPEVRAGRRLWGRQHVLQAARYLGAAMPDEPGTPTEAELHQRDMRDGTGERTRGRQRPLAAPYTGPCKIPPRGSHPTLRSQADMD